jgi:exopolyphosphatase / guanosine-5'-triphosphate,3'-diphosphate pyrophosphatase
MASVIVTRPSWQHRLDFMRCACVDIGTNTTRVLVAEVAGGRFTEVLQRRAFTRIGTGPVIAPEKIAEVARVVAEQVELARMAGADNVRVVATAAIRAAVNRDDFLDGMTVEVEILDGAEEARLAFLGATHTLGRELPGVVGVVDVGGGSTEIAVGTIAGGVQWSASFLVGSGQLAERYLRSDPPSTDQLEAVREHAREVLATREIPSVEVAVAVGGSAASLRRLVGDALDRRSLTRALEALCAGPCDQVAADLTLLPERVRLLPAGILVLGAAAQRLGRPLQIGNGGLREGLLLDMARSRT